MRVLTVLLSVLLLGVTVFGQVQTTPAALTNADILKMSKAGLAESLIVKEISSSLPAFDTSPNALIELKNQGVSAAVLDAMVSAMSGGGSGASTTAAGEAGGNASGGSASVPEGLWVKVNGRNLPAERTQLAETKTQANTLGGLAHDSMLGQALQAGMGQATYMAILHAPGSYAGAGMMGSAGGIMGGILSNRKPTLTYVWVLASSSAPGPPLPSSPSFEVHDAGIPGINAGEYVPELLRLSPTANNWLLVGATRAKQDTWDKSSPDWPMYSTFLEDRVPARIEQLQPGHFRVSPASALAPGPYAIAFRPVSKSKKFTPTDIARSQGAGLLFNTVWAFGVK